MLEILLLIIISILLVSCVVKCLIKEVTELAAFYIFSFSKENVYLIKKDINIIKVVLKRAKEFLKIRKEQKKHRDMWNKELKIIISNTA